MAASGTGNNRFAHTCARVRQFMMEQNRQVRMDDLIGSSSSPRPLQLTPVPVATGPPPAAAWETDAGARTLPLFPVRNSSSTEIIRPEQEAKATLTIFYQGQVATFHNFPADRAKDLIQMAGSVTGEAPGKGVTTTTAVPEKAGTSGGEPSAAGVAGTPPIARKLTLQRFLRKRKD
ncbi:hypothetical protein ACJX0J_023947, partial [Zea mays]